MGPPASSPPSHYGGGNRLREGQGLIQALPQGSQSQGGRVRGMGRGPPAPPSEQPRPVPSSASSRVQAHDRLCPARPCGGSVIQLTNSSRARLGWHCSRQGAGRCRSPHKTGTSTTPQALEGAGSAAAAGPAPAQSLELGTAPPAASGNQAGPTAPSPSWVPGREETTATSLWGPHPGVGGGWGDTRQGWGGRRAQLHRGLGLKCALGSAAASGWV